MIKTLVKISGQFSLLYKKNVQIGSLLHKFAGLSRQLCKFL
ncbi:hypothetical protein Z950_1016 [Sulfitobacter mediterraneus KCTC 32188]|nr:hypothetical protein Z950_1016 [Sulfitobacter mediterraneus KCTC 32188]